MQRKFFYLQSFLVDFCASQNPLLQQSKNITEMHADIILKIKPSFKLALPGSKIHPATVQNILVIQPVLKTNFLCFAGSPTQMRHLKLAWAMSTWSANTARDVVKYSPTQLHA